MMVGSNSYRKLNVSLFVMRTLSCSLAIFPTENKVPNNYSTFRKKQNFKKFEKSFDFNGEKGEGGGRTWHLKGHHFFVGNKQVIALLFP